MMSDVARRSDKLSKVKAFAFFYWEFSDKLAVLKPFMGCLKGARSNRTVI